MWAIQAGTDTAFLPLGPLPACASPACLAGTGERAGKSVFVKQFFENERVWVSQK